MGIKNIETTETIIWGKGTPNHDSIPKVIWIFWNSDKKTPLVDICINQIKNLLPDYTVNISNCSTEVLLPE